MAADPVEDAWMETFLFSISVIGGTERQFAALTETLDFDIGEKDIEGIPVGSGGRVMKWNPEGDSSCTIEAYPLQAGTDTGSTGLGFYDLLHSQDTSVPIRILNSHTRLRCRILALWTNDATATGAHSATAANASALRIGMAHGHFTSIKPSFTDGILKFTCVYKTTPYDKTGGSNILMESAAGASSDVLPAIAAYTTSNKFG